ncbi:MAG TPA: DUF4147 domain-containing protein, partial [Vicinamibacterales bacterium]|nr:DUF4147 domain-containing protein [Vicinamibacterales bacterium]
MVRAGIAAVDAAQLVERALSEKSGRTPFSGGGATKKGYGPFSVIAAGKAAPAMAAAAARLLGPQISSGLVIAPSEVAVAPPFERIVGGHPTPTAGSERAGRRALALARSAGPDAHLLVLISGGASAMMAVPADGLTLDDKRQATERLLRAGADIHALNTVRKHLSAIKGGWLAAAAAGSCTT